MNSLILLVENLKKSPIKEIIDKRLEEFKSLGKDRNALFQELAFCILAAGTSAELGIKTVAHLGNALFCDSQEDIQKKLKEVYRFHTVRAKYLHAARESFKKIDLSHPDVRLHLVKNIKGIGMKEASHFLRNTGHFDYAIIDFHIVDVLVKHNVLEKPRTMTPKKYLEIENVLRELTKKTNTSLGELDLYLWYNETGKVLK